MGGFFMHNAKDLRNFILEKSLPKNIFAKVIIHTPSFLTQLPPN